MNLSNLSNLIRNVLIPLCRVHTYPREHRSPKNCARERECAHRLARD